MKLLKAILRPFGSSFFMAAAWFALVLFGIVGIILSDAVFDAFITSLICLFTLRALHFFVAGCFQKRKQRTVAEGAPDALLKYIPVIFIILFVLHGLVAVNLVFSAVTSDTLSKMDMIQILCFASFTYYHAVCARNEWRMIHADNDVK